MSCLFSASASSSVRFGFQLTLTFSFFSGFGVCMAWIFMRSPPFFVRQMPQFICFYHIRFSEGCQTKYRRIPQMERKSDSKRVSVRKQPRRRVRRLGCLNFPIFSVFPAWRGIPQTNRQPSRYCLRRWNSPVHMYDPNNRWLRHPRPLRRAE